LVKEEIYKNIEEAEFIDVIGARVHNLKNISVSIPRNKLVVITGLSGSGKSSLAFDTIYAEGQRRYMETFSAYARQFLGGLERPDVDKISGLSPVISIEQKTVNKNPRSTVGTITEIYDFLRLLFARAGDAYSYNTGEKMVQYTDEQIQDRILEDFEGKSVTLLAPLVRGRKGHYRELFEQVQKQGYLRVRVDGKIEEINAKLKLDRYKIHDIELVVDRIQPTKKDKTRIAASIKTAMGQGKGSMLLLDDKTNKIRHFSRNLMCPTTGISYNLPEPNLFSFNSPYGACPKCNGLGIVSEIDFKKLIPDEKLSIRKGGLAPLGIYKNNWTFRQIEALLKKYNCNLDTEINEVPNDVISKILEGTDETVKMQSEDGGSEYGVNFEGIINIINREAQENPSPGVQRWANGFMNKINCPECNGSRLKKESLFFKVADKNISELVNMDISDFGIFVKKIDAKLNAKQKLIATDILKEIKDRVQFLLNVGLEYLTLNRSTKSLSGGEAQRIRLATQIGSQLVGVLYIMDEPSIGLHQRDNQKLIDSLLQLRDAGNSVLVVEHDKDMMLIADYIIDVGPGAGVHGGKIVAEGNFSEFKKLNSLTSQYITGKKQIAIPKKRRKGNGKFLVLEGAAGNNLKNVTIKLPLGKFICMTGVSGSGKSTLINHTLYPILNSFFYNGVKKPLAHKKITGLENLDKVIEIDQSPIGRTPRSNPATYTGMFTEIRTLYTNLPEAKIRGYQAGRFSFNTKGGRCETCQGAGIKVIEMNFLPDVYVNCETCNGKRYNRETLEVRFKGKSIADVLDMTIENAVEFFSEIPRIASKLITLKDVGLGYITLGQQSTTLSGGEAQRIKLASELSKRDTGQTFYILDEPTTGLHFEDISMLINVLNRFVDNGSTVLVIEHNMDIIKVADHIIDMGPEGGNGGGNIVTMGTPEEIVKQNKGYTAKYLAKELH
jgi:excinuclease ABC subunit A